MHRACVIGLALILTACESDGADSGPITPAADSDSSVEDVQDVGGGDTIATADSSAADSPAEPGVADLEGDDLLGEPDVEPPEPPVVSGLTAIENPANVLSYYVQWRTAAPVLTDLTVRCAPDPSHRFVGRTQRTDHEVFVMGLWADADCALEVEAENAAGVEQARGSLHVGQLPEMFPEIALQTYDDEATQPGWTILNLNNTHDHNPLAVAMIDELARYRWYHVRDTENPGNDNDVRLVSEGVLIGGSATPRVWPAIVSWEGEVVWEEELAAHHDMRYDEERGEILFLGTTRDCPERLGSATVNAWSRPEGGLTWTWKICDHYEPPELGNDWSHVNTIEPMPVQGQYLISVRNQNALILIDRGTQDVLWVLGEVGDFALVRPDESAPEPNFYRQHDPEIQPDGHILMFDNGQQGVRESSRALEIAYDLETMEAWGVWEFAPDPPLFTPIWGDADRLPNGNTLITFGEERLETITHLFEVAPDGRVVWEVTMPPAWGVYRSDRVIDPPVGFVLGEEDR